MGDRTCRTAFSIAGASLILMPLALPAAAGVPTTRCAKFVTPAPIAVAGVRTRIATVKGCAGLPAGASGRSVTNLRTHVNVTTWSDGLGTTTAQVTYGGGPRANHCPKGTNLILVHGKVTGGTGAERELFRIGETMSARLCMNEHAAATLEPGSSYRFGATARTNTTTTGTTRTTSAPPRTTSPPTTPTTHKTTTTTTPPTTTTTLAPGGSNPPPPVAVPAGLSACPASANSAMITLVNRDRQQTGNLPALRENVNLDWAARKHSIVMATTSVMSHDRLGHRDPRLELRRRRARLDRSEHRVDDRRVRAEHDRVNVLQRGAAERRAPPEHPQHELPQHRDRLHGQQLHRRVLVGARLRQLRRGGQRG